jgi:hypothetical protein
MKDMKKKIMLIAAMLLICLAVLPFLVTAEQKQKKAPSVDLGAFVKEIMILKMDGDKVQLATRRGWYKEGPRKRNGISQTVSDNCYTVRR